MRQQRPENEHLKIVEQLIHTNRREEFMTVFREFHEMQTIRFGTHDLDKPLLSRHAAGDRILKGVKDTGNTREPRYTEHVTRQERQCHEQRECIGAGMSQQRLETGRFVGSHPVGLESKIRDVMHQQNVDHGE